MYIHIYIYIYMKASSGKASLPAFSCDDACCQTRLIRIVSNTVM